MKVVWTDRALRRLHELHDYLSVNAPAFAGKIVRELVMKSRRLEQLPYSGRAVPEYERADVRELLARPYRIIYRVRAERNRVDVLSVRHYRQLLPSDLKKL
jgi:plasmid stabilization system protein ParE